VRQSFVVTVKIELVILMPSVYFLFYFHSFFPSECFAIEREIIIVLKILIYNNLLVSFNNNNGSVDFYREESIYFSVALVDRRIVDEFRLIKINCFEEALS